MKWLMRIFFDSRKSPNLLKLVTNPANLNHVCLHPPLFYILIRLGRIVYIKIIRYCPYDFSVPNGIRIKSVFNGFALKSFSRRQEKWTAKHDEVSKFSIIFSTIFSRLSVKMHLFPSFGRTMKSITFSTVIFQQNQGQAIQETFRTTGYFKYSPKYWVKIASKAWYQGQKKLLWENRFFFEKIPK